LRAPRGASIAALTARQVGKTTTAAWAIAHAMLFYPGSLSVIACPAQRQSAEAVRRSKEVLVKAAAKFKSDNVYALELENGSRVLALPSGDDTVRGLTVDAWIIATWSRIDPFWKVWDSDDPTWLRLRATAGSDPTLFTAEFLEQERRALGEHAFRREYFGVPGGSEASLFPWELYDLATRSGAPLIPPGPAFQPREAPPVRIPNPFHQLRTNGVIP
jgi:hypothetical protein